MADLHLPLARLRQRHGEIYLIVAPPRSASTALARVLWQHRTVGWYCHEPFDLAYHRGAGPEQAVAALEHPTSVGQGERLVVKEMTFQVGAHFRQLAALATQPVVFLLRDPRLAVSSRMRQREKGGQPPLFPLVETGWHDLRVQIAECRRLGAPYLLLDAADMRSRPDEVLPPLFGHLGLDFSPDLLAWRPAGEVELGALAGEQSAWYERVLASRSLEPDRQTMPGLESFPAERGFREHVRECLEIYEDLCADERRIR